MAIKSFKKIGITGIKKNEKDVIDYLYKYGNIELIGQQEKITDESSSEDLMLLQNSIRILSELSDQKESFFESLFGVKPIVNKDQYDSVTSDFDAVKKSKVIINLNREINKLNSELIQKNTEKETLKQWRQLSVSFSDIKKIDSIELKTGWVSNNDTNFHKQILANDYCYNETIFRDKNKTAVAFIYLKTHKEKILDIIKDTTFQEISFSDKYTSKIILEIQNINNQINKIHNDINDKNAVLKKESNDLIKYKIVFDYMNNNIIKGNANKYIVDTDKSFSLLAWVPADAYDNFQRSITGLFNVHIWEEPLKENEDIPIFLDNSKVIKPFSMISKLYGLPNYKEFDPTILLAPFFAVFFAVCLTDAGYGLLLVLLSYYMLKKYNLPETAQELFNLLKLGGFFTIVAGMLTGGYFGLEIDAIAVPGIQSAMKNIMLFNPISSPMTMLLVSLGMGIIQIITGIIIKMIYNIKYKRYVEALLDQFLWVVFLVCLILLGLSNSGVLSFGHILNKITWGIVIMLVITQGRDKKGIISKFFAGVLSLYDVVGYLGDTLSYARLMALGIGTGVIAMVVNNLGIIFKDMIGSVPGTFILFIILVGGHIFNLIINSLGAFIHTTRLQFVEYFTKFFEGGGKIYKPFKPDWQYIDLSD